jgi:cell wall-associated NlpC family hydrolase
VVRGGRQGLLVTGTDLESFVLPALATGFEVTQADTQVADLVLFGGTALSPAVAAGAGQARLAGIVLGEGEVRHEEFALSQHVLFMRTSIRHDG